MQISNRMLTMLATATIVGSVAAGCGGDSDGGGVDTGLEETKLLSDVTADESERACNNIQTSFRQRFNRDTVVTAACTLVSAAAASTPAACNDLRAACIEEANQPGSETMMDIEFEDVDFECGDAGSGMSNLADCGDATVGELERCFDDTLNQLTAVLNRITCADAATVDMDDVQGFGDQVGEPAQSCEVLECAAGQPFGG